MKRTTLILGFAAALAACSHNKKPEAKEPEETAQKPVSPPPKGEAPKVDQDKLVSGGIALSDDIMQACGITGSAQASNPTFDYDKEDLSPEDRNVLDKIATCLTTGALKGKAVLLIGRADPRGTEEYNLGLGSRRSNSVNQYLVHLGVPQPQLAGTTRGALDATGTDEEGYKKDRRVDIQMNHDKG
ncbi:MAG TPA: OmpA family protein [Kofleriaceae bacterium]|jgi:peptidoglycan-associated lipoprotein